MTRVCFQLQVCPDRIEEYTCRHDETAQFFVDLGDASPDTGFIELREIIHLEDQLAGLDPTVRSDQQ